MTDIDDMTDYEVIVESLIILLKKEAIRVTDDKEHDRIIDLQIALEDTRPVP